MKALITGASRGLGLALAGALAREGWELVLDARGGPELEKAAAGLGAVTTVAGDVSDPAHRAALIDAADGLDLLVNNASTLGATPLPPLAAYPLDELAQAFAVNAIGPLALIQGLLPVLRERRGAIVNISSDAATEPYEGWGGYGATKAALEQLSNVLAAEEPDVAVWWVDPGEMRTGMLAAAGEDAEAAPRPEEVAVPALLRLVAERPPSGRYTASGLAR
ncbi:SDR family NAD(P)-dependent oxidoreductase [Actinoallomurus iriomotensis]|uniref:Short-chain dehydrogenase n=1 Tax=Actinoallomurus iriomotensis TaxID=478107 RepID=A0A9W6RSR6_9ACTN|nr:SDR family oxidoreductase [Actinoallomurus iriomotensis]GLY81043.1 short-chain dehydrogenase [Actinoallomurus iriomotensis]